MEFSLKLCNLQKQKKNPQNINMTPAVPLHIIDSVASTDHILCL